MRRGLTPAPESNPRTLLAAFAALALAGLGLRLGVAFRSLDIVDRLFIPDDTYYTLSIARSMAEGLGPAADGVHLTSGFQPLLAFLLVPVFAITGNPDIPLRFALVLLSVVDVGSALLLGCLALRWGGRVAGVLAVAMWAFSPVAISNALNGLETALVVFCQLALVELWCRARERQSPHLFALAGVFAGLAILARIDSVALVAALGLFQLFRRPRRDVFVAAAAAALVVAPWWIYSTVRFGSPVPQSGAAVREVVAYHQFPLSQPLGWAAGTLIATPFAELERAQRFLFAHQRAAVVAWLAVALVMSTGAWFWFTRRQERTPLLALTVHGLAILCLYSFFVSAIWFFRRYLAPAQALITLLLAMSAGAAWHWRLGRQLAGKAVAGVLSVGVLLGLGASLRYCFVDPPTSPDREFRGAKGYREPVREIMALTPDGAVVGSLQSGALGYYARKGVTVVNFDGVVDAEAAAAVRQRQLGGFARERHVSHLADWPFNLGKIMGLSGDPPITEASLRAIGVGRPQGTDQFVLVEIDWPDGGEHVP